MAYIPLISNTNLSPGITSSKACPAPPYKDKTLRINKTQFRRFAEIAKQYGVVLEIRSLKDMEGGKAIGQTGFMLMGARIDASDPKSYCTEQGNIMMAESWSTNYMKGCNRPEMDWSAIPTDLMQEFVLWHEIGHQTYNFSMMDLLFNKSKKDLKDRYYRKVIKYNEILADRFAWEKVLPGEPLPWKEGLTQKDHDQIESDLAELMQVFGLKNHEIKPLPQGQYKCVSTNMLRTERLAAFVGPKAIVHKPMQSGDLCGYQDVVFTGYIRKNGKVENQINGKGVFVTEKDALEAAKDRCAAIGGSGYASEWTIVRDPINITS